MNQKAIITFLAILLIAVLAFNIISLGWPRLVDAVGRELQIAELKAEVKDLRKQVEELKVTPYMKNEASRPATKTAYPWDQ